MPLCDYLLEDVLNLLKREDSDLAARLLQDDAPVRLLAQLELLEFESRKRVVL